MALSKSLSNEAREKIIDFVEACIESVRGEIFQEESSALAKKKGVELLQTDIDIVMVLLVVSTMYTSGMALIKEALDGRMSAGEVARIIVKIVEQGRIIDIGTRQN